MSLKVFGATYSQNWVGGSAVVVAENFDDAVKLINQYLAANGEQTLANPSDVFEVDTSSPRLIELTNGDY